MDDVAERTHSEPRVAAAAKPRASRRKIVRLGIAGVVVVAAIVAGVAWWLHSRHYASTDNAYVNANTVDVAAQVTGQVVAVYVRDQQAVDAGDPLFDIDPRNYDAALAKAEAQLALARQSEQQQQAAVSVARAQLAQREAEEVNARHNETRTQQLVASGFYSKQGGEAARTAALTASAAVQAAQAAVVQAQSALGETGEANASVRAAEAAVEQAKLDLEHTKVRAPTSGTVANFSLRPGNTVMPGTPLFSIVGNTEYWVDANFKETELARIRPGQAVTIEVDMYPKHPFRGVVESVSAGSGSAFSLLPPQNATGNWVKVTQRVPVRVRVVENDPQFPLRIGTTATVRVALD
jgi:membrane fusion protein (multidrug efflux system)